MSLRRKQRHVAVGEWLLDLGMPTPRAVRLKQRHEQQHPDGWRSCERCVNAWSQRHPRCQVEVQR